VLDIKKVWAKRRSNFMLLPNMMDNRFRIEALKEALFKCNAAEILKPKESRAEIYINEYLIWSEAVANQT
jgi:hypothetical protein